MQFVIASTFRRVSARLDNQSARAIKTTAFHLQKDLFGLLSGWRCGPRISNPLNSPCPAATGRAREFPAESRYVEFSSASVASMA